MIISSICLVMEKDSFSLTRLPAEGLLLLALSGPQTSSGVWDPAYTVWKIWPDQGE